MPLRSASPASSFRASPRPGRRSALLAVARGGAVVFAGSLLYFAYFYAVRLGRPVAVATDAVAGHLAVNVLLFSVFALHHSIFARTGVKAAVSRAIPRRLERSLYVWIASLLFLAVCLLWRPLPGVAWQTPGLGRWLLHGAQLGGLWLTLRSAARIDIWELAGIRQARDAASDTDRSAESAESAAPLSASSGLESTLESVPASSPEIGGPYRWVRHPIYLGWVLMVFATPTMTAGRLLFAAVSTIYLIVAIPFEERSLTAEFGPSYTDYRRQVRWRLIPGLW